MKTPSYSCTDPLQIDTLKRPTAATSVRTGIFPHPASHWGGCNGVTAESKFLSATTSTASTVFYGTPYGKGNARNASPLAVFHLSSASCAAAKTLEIVDTMAQKKAVTIEWEERRVVYVSAVLLH